MGKVQSKTLGSVLGLSNQESGSVGGGGMPLSQAHSGSFDSVNTTTSFGIERNPIHRSNSVDSLVPKGFSRVLSKLNFSLHGRKSNSKTYDSLVESASVVTTFSACERTKEFSRSYPEDTTCKGSTKYGTGSGKRADNEAPPPPEGHMGNCALQKDGDVSSNHFLVELEPETTATEFAGCVREESSQITDDGRGEAESSSVLPRHLHPSIIQKLSREDWHELISYTCTTLGQSLLASILDHPSLLEHLVRMDHISPPFDESSPSMIKEGPAPLTHETSDEYARNIESMLEKLRFPNHVQVGDRTTKKKLERTTSLPPLRHFRIGVSEPEGSGTILNEHGDFHYQLKHNREEVYGKHISDRADFCRAPRDGSELQQSPIQRTPMEGEGKKCMRDRERPNGRNHTNCLHGRHHSSHGKKMRGRSRSDSVRDPRSHVDTSLDDDCPGIPENRIRRPKHHHQHQHFVCKQCTEEFGPSPWNRGKLTKKGWCRKHSPDHENVNSSGSGSERTLVGPVVFMTPEDMQMATLLLERSTELGKESDNEENVGKGYEDSSSKIDGHTSQHHSGSAGVLHDTKHHGHTSQHHSGSAGVLHDTKHHGHTSQHHSGSAGVLHGTKHHLKINNNSCLPNGRMVTPKEASERHEIVDWSDLPVTSNRSGRDSPATDMAVACLDMNSPRMLQPLGGRSQGLPEQGEVRHMYFHNHQHYHHFIHHSQP